MASARDHIELANRNQEALDFLLSESERFPEWITSVAFYKALHVVDAMFASLGIPPQPDHMERARELKKERRFENVHKHYRSLWNASLIARYLSDLDGTGYRKFTDYLSAAQVPSDMVRHRLHQVEESAIALMGKKNRSLASSIKRAVAPSRQEPHSDS